MVKVYRFRMFGPNGYEAPRMAAREFIETVRGEIVDGSELEVEASLVDDSGQVRPAPAVSAMSKAVLCGMAAALAVPIFLPPSLECGLPRICASSYGMIPATEPVHGPETPDSPPASPALVVAPASGTLSSVTLSSGPLFISARGQVI